MRSLRPVTLVILTAAVVAAIWIGISLMAGPPWQRSIVDTAGSKGAVESPLSPKATAVASDGHKKALSLATWSGWLIPIGQVLTVVSAALTTIIGVIAAGFNLPTPTTNSAATATPRAGRKFNTIAFLGALATACTVFGNQASGQADKLRTRADALQGEVVKITDAIRNHPDHEDELIEELKLRIAEA
jgi:hypothetical protein